MIEFIPSGVCSKKITFRLENNIVREVRFYSGCSGNLQGISQLVEGRPAEEIIERLTGIHCGEKFTSCPDQLARALRLAIRREDV